MRWATLVDFLFPATCVECDGAGAGLCPSCFSPSDPLRFAIGDLDCSALGAYEGVLRRAVLAVKSGRRDVAESLGVLLGAQISPRRLDLLVPVPTTAARRRERGFDQAVLLARVASRISGVPSLGVLRHQKSDAQRGRSRSERLLAVGRFARSSESLSPGARVLLVDDVATTGATLRDCALTLRTAGARIAGALVVARA